MSMPSKLSNDLMTLDVMSDNAILNEVVSLFFPSNIFSS
jgi:hypothetical protein